MTWIIKDKIRKDVGIEFDRHVMYNPTTDLYLRIERVNQSSGYISYNITWDSLKVSTSFREYYVNRILDTFWCMTDKAGGCEGACVHELVDMQVSRGFIHLLDRGEIKSIGEIQVVPVDCDYTNTILTIVGVNFLLAESIL